MIQAEFLKNSVHLSSKWIPVTVSENFCEMGRIWSKILPLWGGKLAPCNIGNRTEVKKKDCHGFDTWSREGKAQECSERRWPVASRGLTFWAPYPKLALFHYRWCSCVSQVYPVCLSFPLCIWLSPFPLLDMGKVSTESIKHQALVHGFNSLVK